VLEHGQQLTEMLQVMVGPLAHLLVGGDRPELRQHTGASPLLQVEPGQPRQVVLPPIAPRRQGQRQRWLRGLLRDVQTCDRRAVPGDDGIHALTQELLDPEEVAHDLESGPLVRDRPLPNRIGRHGTEQAVQDVGARFEHRTC
jgi:hypothetical protein